MAIDLPIIGQPNWGEPLNAALRELDSRVGVPGEKGDKGDKGDPGEPGKDGTVTPEMITLRDESVAARDKAETYSASAQELQDVAVESLIRGENGPTGTLGALRGEIAAPGVPSISLLSSTDRKADTKRIRITSSQKQEATNSYDGGESIWLDLESPLAKSMLTWRLRYDPVTRKVYPEGTAPAGAPFRRVVWAGAHWFAQNQPDDDNPTVIHGHWSVEVPDKAGALQTRFQVFFNDRDDPAKVGTNRALIGTNRADFMVEAATIDGKQCGRFIMAGGQADERFVEFTRGTDALDGRRWAMGANKQPESAGDVGADFVLKRYSNDGTELGHALLVRRANGEVTVGSDDWSPPSDPSLVMAKSDGGAQNGVFVYPKQPLTTGAAFKARFSSVGEMFLQSRVGTNGARFQATAVGKLGWGDGSAVDTFLYRDAFNRLKTDGELIVSSNVRTGSATGAGGSASIVVGNGTPPTSTSASQFSLYSEGGVPKFSTAKGVVRMEPQPAIPNAVDGTDVVAKLNDLLLKLRTVGLISS